ncbi:MAG: S9 family peptidase [Burkholderiaceae bacterium]|nr:S9 family peptidase [Burkholderiaceae bacterium]
MTIKLFLFMLVIVGLGGCAIAPSHPSLTNAALPTLIPVRDFVADRESTGAHSVSPDGKKIAWLGVDGVSSAVWVKTIGQNDAKAFHSRARYYRWSADSRYLAVVIDQGGDEDMHIYVGSVAGSSTQLVDRTPFAKTVSHILRAVDDTGQAGAELVVTSNRRDKKVFDLYKLNLVTGQQSLMATNPGTVVYWGVDRLGKLRARVLLQGEQSLLQVPESALQNTWKTTASWSRFDSMAGIDFLDDGLSAWALSNRGRDKMALVKLELATGAETVVYAAPEVDVDRVLISRKTHQPLAAYSMPSYPRQEVFEAGLTAGLSARFTALAGGKPAGIYVSSIDDSEQTFTVAVSTDRGTKNYLFAGKEAKPVLLGENSISRLADALSSTQPIAFTSRDGLELHGYLTLPAGVAPKNLPMVLYVHGGPWARDRWGEGRAQQMLANRGYAVLQVNYRGSSGYGRVFQAKAMGEFAGKMHDDLIDGVQWAVKTGVADPAKVAIYGASYGGYAALVGATFTPEVFACAVDMVGVTSLARLLETVPAYWELGLPWWHRFVGDPSKPADRAVMDAKSPLFRADKATQPILIMHGVNDPRVKLDQSELMVAALKKAGKQVEYITFKGDGHGNLKWSNNLTMYRQTEDFLASCLGGRSSGFDYYQLGAWAF